MEKQWNSVVEQIRQPKVVLILVLLLGLLIDGSLYIYRIMPQVLPMHNITVQHNQLEKQRLALEKAPIPPKILPAQIQTLVQQVPLSTNTAAFLITLREVEVQSGVEIESVSDGSSAKKEAANELITSDGKANLPNANYSTPKSKGAADTSDTASVTTPPTVGGDPKNAANFAPYNLEVSVLGTYSELMNFINRLAELPRFVSVREWDFGDGSTGASVDQTINGILSDPPASGALPVNDSLNKKRIKLKLSIYSAAQFKGKFPDLPPISIKKDPENRLDPTLTDDQYNKILDSLINR
jgi:Tfp pilus assembly protein PilO